ncbi:flagellar motor switch phosphatase FliY [Paenibacillus sp.]|uniref:flagellar motor switch phosphatase FliY n=1 Tax=Paenibacillus sp. TaxID=58172 RepID=UPI002D47052A|nr:flagellar motor switch phosphatase FliY [Paenibacillus sp.]HZG84390.1 flagellar motor switch phosphatase FliY [Paenibacillus sp.]
MTNKDYLSQEEIDALLRQSEDASGVDSFGGGGFDAGLSIDDYLSPIEQDALGEIGNITFGSAATALSTLLGRKVDITTPKVSAIAKDDVAGTFPNPHVAVHVNYVDGFHGINLLVIKTRDAQVIADLMLGGSGHPEETELNEIHISAVQEAMNQMMGSSATSMSTIFNRFVNISPPGIDVLNFAAGEGDKLLTEEAFIQISFRLTIGDLIDSSIMQLLPVWFAKDMVSILMGGTSAGESPPPSNPRPAASPPPAPAPAAQAPPPAPPQQPQHAPPPPAYPEPPAPAYGGYPPPPPHYQAPYPPPYPPQPYAAPYGAPQQPQYAPPPPPPPNRNVQQAQFADLAGFGTPGTENTNLNLLLDIPLKVTVELGRTQKQIKDILELSQGSIVELDKLAGEPVDILVNNKLIAKGEVVVIDENFGVRVTDIVSPWDRIQKLQ